MNYLLDTCCISELVKKRPDPAVINWFNEQDEFSLFLSIITIGELRKGIEKLPDSIKKEELNRWVNEDLSDRFRNRLIDITIPEVNRWGQILAEAEQRGKPLPAIDSLIAATADVHGLTVVTRNSKDMEATGIEMFNPWQYKREE